MLQIFGEMIFVSVPSVSHPFQTLPLGVMEGFFRGEVGVVQFIPQVTPVIPYSP
jgi:hypothetical protein